MKRFHSLKDIERERYRLYLEKELAGYKLKYFFRNAKTNYSIENLFQESIGNWVGRLIGGLIRKKPKT
ncbi:hypothetical protein GCQ56_03890 [Marinifilum sp. N1E240]|uniref:hypothetical protein n=1 Tax=Marinifilum sp. N1E240 TaxID=2608082 RepID=UPI00128B77B7|nr:hypothetical protein [Marinifilum sp. N1E240]MPQ46143.1 hypothetical protein [Marinifilum sp. N1E240]